MPVCRDALEVASQVISAPAGAVMDELAAVANIVTMSNIVIAQLQQQANATGGVVPSTFTSDVGVDMARCLCSRSLLGVRSCTCPDADVTESARVWLEVARIVDGVSARRLPELVPKCVLVLFAWWCAPQWSQLTLCVSLCSQLGCHPDD